MEEKWRNRDLVYLSLWLQKMKHFPPETADINCEHRVS